MMETPTAALAPGIWDVHTGEPVSEETLFERLGDARFVLVGESHDSAADHAIQLRVLRGLAQRGHVALGMEMFQRPFQAPLDAFIAGEIDEAQMLEATEWEKRWGFATELYRPLWTFARENQLPILALNARRELTKRIAKVGIDGLTDQERADLPEIDLSSERYRTWMRDIFASHGSEMEPAKFERFYQAQVTWDETMADTAARWAEAHPDATVLIVVGRGHIERDFGIPSRLRRRSDGPVVTIVPVDPEAPAMEWMRDEKFADYVWVRK